MSEYTIGQAADILGVTPRTLRHWDAVGLLRPEWRTLGQYRLYTEEELERGMNILVYRAAGVPLAQIGELIDAPATRREHLLRQRRVLVEKAAHLRGMIRAVDAILEGEATMSVEDKIKIFGENWPVYQAEAQERWGDTPEWEESQRRLASMTPQDAERLKAEAEEFRAALETAAERGVQPGSKEADALAARHRESVGKFYEVTAAKQVILARMYVADERFREAYGEHCEYLRDVVEAHAAKEGVDLNAVEWR
ncbi:MerR family transcriptional regulator [Corynebacterium lowii]|uniref:HTH-type transcriptional activator TipA n=1 Tax=Corynebacterium lowii TaxID=1544413 RepID=A0A0Q0Z3U5_9CORY|nr:MerR family transcriptional regulator [Corynebacterium lowii]KQB84009.1 HTH-type transcriptional activator TipA [Corynebacterium lowii]MDP9852741.1 DNA-binding transcriptional MerR regulator [Corynebacterium lowii]